MPRSLARTDANLHSYWPGKQVCEERLTSHVAQPGQPKARATKTKTAQHPPDWVLRRQGSNECRTADFIPARATIGGYFLPFLAAFAALALAARTRAQRAF